MEIVVITLVIVILAQIWERSRLEGIHSKQILDLSQRYTEEHYAWAKERQQLLDRIQAPSFDHLKHHEVRTIKAQSGEKEPSKIEQL